MATYNCTNCQASFILPKGQSIPRKCGVCTKLGALVREEAAWSCLLCGTKNGTAKKACQGCSVQKVTQKATREGVRAKPDGNLHGLRDKTIVKRVKAIVE